MSVATAVSKRLIPVCLALVGLGADEAPKFGGTSIPDPPRQKEPWTPPPTRLPRFLVSATAALFEAGLADPRGCEYREVDVADGAIVNIRGFVLPPREGETGRFAIGWDGAIYPAVAIHGAADLEEDIRALIDSLSAIARPPRPARRGDSCAPAPAGGTAPAAVGR